jgi:hypothetical protein
MAKLNTLKSSPARTTIVTHEGAPAKRIDAEAQLRRSVMACLLWEDQFYEDGQSIADRIVGLVAEVAPEKVAAIAIEAREQQQLRHVPLLLVDALAKNPKSRGVVAETLARVIQRADELAEFLAIYWRTKRQPLAAQVKRGLAKAFTKFNAYTLAKYNRDEAVKLRDVLFLCHAKPKDEEQAATWKQLIDGTLPAPDTWEVALSAGKDKKATWERLITEQNLGGLAFLRNLRNMQEVGVSDDLIRQGLATLKAQRVLPFRFIAAAKFAARFESEIEAAMFRNTAELPKLGGKTALLVDHSGSMNVPLSGKSDLSRFEAGAALAILLREVCEQITVIAFSTNSTVVPSRRGFALADALREAQEWGGTFTEGAKKAADHYGYDRIIIVTDEQSHEALSHPKGKGYVVNVASYKNGIGYGAWTHIDGWSESIVRYIQASETPPNLS